MTGTEGLTPSHGTRSLSADMTASMLGARYGRRKGLLPTRQLALAVMAERGMNTADAAAV